MGATGWGGTGLHTWWTDYCPLCLLYLEVTWENEKVEKIIFSTLSIYCITNHCSHLLSYTITFTVYINLFYIILLPGRVVLISSMYSSIEVRALYPAHLMVTFGCSFRSCACSERQQTCQAVLTQVCKTLNQTVVYSSKKFTHWFAVVKTDNIAVWHRYEAIPPLPILLQVLKKTPWEDGPTGQRVLKKHRYTHWIRTMLCHI